MVVQGAPAGLPQGVRRRLEAWGRLEVEGKVAALWCQDRATFLRALVSLADTVVPSSLNFRFLQPRAKAPRAQPARINCAMATALACRVFLTEEQIFSFDWKAEKLYRDNTGEKALSRHLTCFIKTVRCAEVAVTDSGLTVAFHCPADLEAALRQFCSSGTDSLAKLAAAGGRSFTLLPSRGSYGVFSALRVQPGHFSRFGKCQANNCSVWFASKHSMVRALRDAFVQRTYPALWIDFRNIFIMAKTSVRRAAPPAAPADPGVTCPQLARLLEQCRRTAARLGLQPRHGHIPSARLTRTGYQHSHVPRGDMGAAAATAAEDQHEKQLTIKLRLLRAVTAEEASEVTRAMLEGEVAGLTGPTLRDLKVARVEDFLKDSLGIDNTAAARDKVEHNTSFNSFLASIEEISEEEGDDFLGMAEEAKLESKDEAKNSRERKTEVHPSLQKKEARRAIMERFGLVDKEARAGAKEGSVKQEEEKFKEAGKTMDTKEKVAELKIENNEKSDRKEQKVAEHQENIHESEAVGLEAGQDEQKVLEQEKIKEEKLKETEKGISKDASPDKSYEKLEENNAVGKAGTKEKRERSSETEEQSVKEGKLADCKLGKDENVENENVSNSCESESMLEEPKVSQSEDEKSKVAETKNAEEVASIEDSGLGATLGDTSQAAAEQDSVNMESLAKESKEEEKKEDLPKSDAANKEEVATKEAALVLVVTPAADASLSTLLEQVREDMEWFDVPGLEIAEVEGELEVAVEDRELGMAAMVGLRHKYNIKPKVSWIRSLNSFSCSIG